jgi:hypothetical protein
MESSMQESKRTHEFLQQAISRVEAQLNDTEEQFRLSAGAPAKSFVNINKRTQAVRMLRGGEPRTRVAAALGMTLGELELLTKVQALVQHSYGTTGEAVPAGHSKNDLSV